MEGSMRHEIEPTNTKMDIPAEGSVGQLGVGEWGPEWGMGWGSRMGAGVRARMGVGAVGSLSGIPSLLSGIPSPYLVPHPLTLTSHQSGILHSLIFINVINNHNDMM